MNLSSIVFKNNYTFPEINFDTYFTTINSRFFSSRFPLPFGLSFDSLISLLGMNNNWWDLVGLIGRSNEMSPILSKDGSLSNSTNLNLPEWVLRRLDNFVDNVIKNGSADFRYPKHSFIYTITIDNVVNRANIFFLIHNFQSL